MRLSLSLSFMVSPTLLKSLNQNSLLDYRDICVLDVVTFVAESNRTAALLVQRGAIGESREVFF